jgi:phage anti-repressor protein
MNINIKIIKRQIGDEEINLISMRELHKALEFHKDFGEWAKDTINYYCFIEDVDYTKEADDYIISLAVAKYLVTDLNTFRSRELKKYFIREEREWIHNSHNRLNYKTLDVNQFLNVSLMREMRKTLGRKITKKFYCKLLSIDIEN